MFGHIPETQFDLHFRVLGIPVRIHPAFFLVSLIFGWHPYNPNPLLYALIWTGCVFFSILVHELGHAVMAHRFGWPPSIVLYHFGGLASYVPTWGHTRGKRIAICLAGPGAGFVLYGLVRLSEFLMLRQGMQISEIGDEILDDLKFINLWWGLVNLLPVYPLDGGQVAEQLLKSRDPRRGMEWTLQLGIVTGIAAAVGIYMYYHSIGIQHIYPSLLFGMLAFNNYQMLQQIQRGGWGNDPW